MAELSKISGVAIADVAAVDAVLKANIASILGLTLPSGAAFLLDTYTGAAAGYSVRRIASGATNLMRIREDSGDTETDIGYDSNGDLDLAAIASHCGTANGFVVSWVDQSGNGNNATQSTQGNQPQIYDGTAVLTENGKPAIGYVGGKLLIISSTLTTSANFQLNYLGTTQANHFPIGGSNSFLFYSQTTLTRFRGLGIDLNYSRTLPASATQELYTIDRSSGTASLRINAVTGATGARTGNANLNTLGDGQGSTNGRYTGNQQEYVLWNSDQSSNRTGIETNINDYFSIY